MLDGLIVEKTGTPSFTLTNFRFSSNSIEMENLSSGLEQTSLVHAAFATSQIKNNAIKMNLFKFKDLLLASSAVYCQK